MRARWKRSLRIRSSWIGVWRHIKPFMPLFQLIERYPLGIECASKKCVALYDGLIFFFHNGSLSSYWVKTDGSWHCARYMLKGTVWSPCWMRKNVSDATVCPYISPQCGIGRFCASGKWSALGRYWYGTETIPCLRLRKWPNGDWRGLPFEWYTIPRIVQSNDRFLFIIYNMLYCQRIAFGSGDSHFERL